MKEDDPVELVNDVFVFDPKNPKEYSSIEKPQKGEPYTVREIVETTYGKGIRLKEIVNKKIWHSDSGYQEPIFAIERFRIRENKSS